MRYTKLLICQENKVPEIPNFACAATFARARGSGYELQHCTSRIAAKRTAHESVQSVHADSSSESLEQANDALAFWSKEDVLDEVDFLCYSKR